MTQPQTTLLFGHLVDIDSQDNLRNRPHSGIVWDAHGKILAVDSLTVLEQKYPNAQRIDCSDGIVVPGAIDCHLHFPQTQIIAHKEEELLHWLNTHVWPEEQRFQRTEYAAQIADRFLHELFRNGTTSALVFGSQFADANDVLFEKAWKNKMALFTGVTLQNRNTHPKLELSLDIFRSSSFALLEKWHHRDRLGYVATSRFSPACTDELHILCKELMNAKSGVFFQSHINESPSEIEWVQGLFPNHLDYLDTYDTFGLLGDRSFLAHSVHTSDTELKRLGESQTRIVHCPSSNNFLGSGAFPWNQHLEHRIPIALGTDVAAGISFSMWREAGHSFLVQMQLPKSERKTLIGSDLLRMITMDGAKALQIQDQTGNFEVGKWADVVHLRPISRTLPRLASSLDAMEQYLFSLAILGESEMVHQTFVAGSSVFQKR